MTLTVTRVTPPSASAIEDWYSGADLLDSYAVTLPADAPRDLAALATALFSTPPFWIQGLLRLRDGLMRPLGVKTTIEIGGASAIDGRDHIAFFPVIRRLPTEIVLGEDDRHLDFRASVMMQTDEPGGARRLVVTTAVRRHNLLGRVYLGVITPFHVLIVRSSLGRVLDSARMAGEGSP
jgi:hypothetical protein